MTNAQDAADAGDAASEAIEKADKPTHTVAPERLLIELEVDGTFYASGSKQIALRTNAWSKLEVVDVVAHGAVVQKGTRLLSLELDDLKRALIAAEHERRLAELAQRSAEVALEALRVTTPIEIEASKRRVDEAKADLDYYLTVTKVQAEQSAEQSIKRAKYSLEYAQEELDQLTQMYEEDDLTEETEEIILKRAQRTVESAEFSLESTEIRIARTLETDLPREERSRRESTIRATANAEKTLTALGAGIQQAEIELQKKQLDLQAATTKVDGLKKDLAALSSIVAPIDGYVYYGQFREGKWSGKEKMDNYLKPGGTIPVKSIVMTIVPPQATHLRGTVKEAELRDVRSGLAGTVTSKFAPNTETDVAVESVGRVPVSAGSFVTLFRLANSIEGVVAGMSGQATLTIYDRPDALQIPKSAVFTDGAEQVVYLADGDERRVVKTGRSKGDRVEITRGLNAGEKILLQRP